MQSLVIVFLLIFSSVDGSRCPIYVTISNNLAAEGAVLIVNWDQNCEKNPNKLKVFDKNPYLGEAQTLLEIDPKVHKLKKFVTNVKFNTLEFPRKWELSHHDHYTYPNESSNCLNFYVLSFNQTNHVTNFECLKINPQWMSETKEIWQFPLKHLLIPGTKCSACYMTRSNSRQKNLRHQHYKQNLNVWQQLVFGVRYLEFSVGYFRSFHRLFNIEERFFIFSGKEEISPLFKILKDVKRFVELSGEIVILNFNDFVYGFHDDSNARVIFMKLLRKTFGDVAFVNERNESKAFDLTIEKMKSTGKYFLILCSFKDLEDDAISTEITANFVWPSWKRIFVETQRMSEISSSKFGADNNDGWIADFISIHSKKHGLDYINEINSRALSAMNGAWCLEANVVPLDFILSTNLIDISLYVNQQKSLQTYNHVVIDA